MIKNNLAFILIVASALFLRILISLLLVNPQFVKNNDLLRYMDWGKITYQYGIKESYNPKHISVGILPNNQPPGTTYIDYSAYYIYKNNSIFRLLL